MRVGILLFALLSAFDVAWAEKTGSCNGEFSRLSRTEPGSTRTYQIYLTESPYHHSFRIRAALTPSGLLMLDLRTRHLITHERTSSMSGSQALEEIVKHFGNENIKAIKGDWAVGTNLDTFNELIAEGVRPEQAATQTWTGRKCAKLGFTQVEKLSLVGRAGDYEEATVLFSRPEHPVTWAQIPEVERNFQFKSEGGRLMAFVSARPIITTCPLQKILRTFLQ